MNNKEFIAKVAERAGENASLTKKLVDATFETIMEDVFAVNESVRTSIGTFSGIDKPARVARNPITGEEVVIGAKTGYPKFKASKRAKE